jgi:uncharacterized SAM-binding protein YcdF (DUF218 family)
VIDPILLRGIVKTLVLPPTGLLLLALLGLVIHRRFPRGGIAMAWVGVLGLLVLSVPAVATFLVRSLDTSPPFDPARASGAQAIVILGGGTRSAQEYGGETLGELTLERVRYGARVARATGLPVLVSGGSVYGGAPEAALMRDALEREFGVPVRWTEERSRDTHENALYSAAILHSAGIHRVVLVAHSFDMPRARAELAATGVETIPAPTGIPSAEPHRPSDFIPGVAGLHASYYAVYEMLANLVLWLGGGLSS